MKKEAVIFWIVFILFLTLGISVSILAENPYHLIGLALILSAFFLWISYDWLCKIFGDDDN